MEQPAQATSMLGKKTAVAICAGMLVMFYALGWFAVAAESATADEPLHAAAGYLNLFQHDFRVNPEDPPLWKYFAMIPHHAGELTPDPDVQLWQDQLSDVSYQFAVTTRLLFQIRANDGAAFIDASRSIMLLLGVVLGAAIARWSWQLAGATAAIVTCALFSFDPNFLGHAPLVKNDVSMTLVLFATAWACWSVGKRARWWNLLLLAALCGVALSVKFSGVLIGPIVALLLLTRAMLPQSWRFLRWELTTRTTRMLAAAGTCAASAMVAVAIVWACYGFRFDPTPTPGVLLNTNLIIDRYKDNVYFLDHGNFPKPQQRDALPVPAVAKLVLFAQDHRLLPQAWLFGILYTYQSTLVRDAYLLGRISPTGFWYYFPLAMLFKTPLATLAAFAIAAGVAIMSRWKFGGARDEAKRTLLLDHWTLACLLIPVGLYAISALTTHLNLGVRHVLPLYPFLYVMVGMAAAKLRRAWPRAFTPIALLLALGLAVPVLAAFPHFISFFNVAARPQRFDLLSDSNFDWGQDLTYLADWQQRHPTTPLYLAYFGTVDPAFYDIHYAALPGNFALGHTPKVQLDLSASASAPTTMPHGVIAVSATILQGTHQIPPVRKYYEALRHRRPQAIVGDTIYLYDWPLR